jgi:protein-disulfide isomerase
MFRTATGLFAALSLAALAACSPKASGGLVQGDQSLGPDTAKVTVVEYLSPTCPGCKAFHDEFWPTLKSDYVDKGTVKFVQRELAIHGAIDFAILSVARCSGKEAYFDVFDHGFENQREIATSPSNPEGAMPTIVALGAKFGMSEPDVRACLQKPENIARHDEVQKLATADGVGSTPSFVVNGVRIDSATGTIPDIWASTKAAIDAELAK